MEHKEKKGREKELLAHIGNCSRNMIENHHLENLSEFVLHDLCSDNGFGIRKAAYFVHNPDFACLKGVSGYHKPEAFGAVSVWQDEKNFTSHMKNSGFNQQVRAYNHDHLSSQKVSDEQVQDIVDYLEIIEPGYHLWKSKHNNQGIFVFERGSDDLIQDDIFHFVHILSFCPMF